MTFTVKKLVCDCGKVCGSVEECQRLWEALISCIEDTMLGGKSLLVPGLCRFMYIKSSKRDLHQGVKGRVFVLDPDFLRAYHTTMRVPSGTALLLGEAAAKGRGIALADHSERGRDGITGARAKGAIGFAALRGGSVAGDHQVILATEGERIELGHRAENRSIFARGAIKGASWLAGQPVGRYDMKGVLGL